MPTGIYVLLGGLGFCILILAIFGRGGKGKK